MNIIYYLFIAGIFGALHFYVLPLWIRKTSKQKPGVYELPKESLKWYHHWGIRFDKLSNKKWFTVVSFLAAGMILLAFILKHLDWNFGFIHLLTPAILISMIVFPLKWIRWTHPRPLETEMILFLFFSLIAVLLLYITGVWIVPLLQLINE